MPAKKRNNHNHTRTINITKKLRKKWPGVRTTFYGKRSRIASFICQYCGEDSDWKDFIVSATLNRGIYVHAVGCDLCDRPNLYFMSEPVSESTECCIHLDESEFRAWFDELKSANENIEKIDPYLNDGSSKTDLTNIAKMYLDTSWAEIQQSRLDNFIQTQEVMSDNTTATTTTSNSNNDNDDNVVNNDNVDNVDPFEQTPTTKITNGITDLNQLDCQICFDEVINAVLVPCGHSLCRGCAEHENVDTCPFCRKKIEVVVDLRIA